MNRARKRRSTILIKNAFRVSSWREQQAKSHILCENGKITGIFQDVSPRFKNIDIIDAKGLYLFPGFIDLHVHGGGNASIWRSNSKDVENICRTHAKFGTTGLLITTFPDTATHLSSQIKAISETNNSHGAKILGIHLEGPHLNPVKTGGLPPERLRILSVQEIENLQKLSRYPIKMITFAPEMEGADEIISFCKENNIVASVAHTCASPEMMRSAIDKGIRHATHIFNTYMFPRNAREPGALETILLDKRVTVQLIADLVTVKEEFVKLLLLIKGWQKIALITDAGSVAGTCGAPEVMRAKDGRIIASTLTMNKAVCIMTHVGIPLEKSVRMASEIPAKIISVSKNKGSISIGRDADLLLIDENLNVKLTMCEGNIVFSSL
ncbi:MAG: N-acetylglucosamine-6-phosphate deacetylase [Planctomycetota bacterium]